MPLMSEKPPLPSDPDAGIWRGRPVARRFLSPDGWVVLVGRTAEDNDILTFRLGAPQDFWLHVSGESGSHVIVRNPERLDRLPRETLHFAAALAARHSKARKAGTVTVHITTCAEVSKPRGLPAGKVTLRHFRSIRTKPDQV
jgi:predicted ribosome quality control (RQC) complex YloA/Tae2 family protein